MRAMSHAKKVTIQLNSAFSPYLHHGESLRYASPTGLPPRTDKDYGKCVGATQGKPIKKGGIKTYFRGRAFVNPERKISEQLIHQSPAQPLITIPPEKFVDAVKIQVYKGKGKLRTEILGLSILPNTSKFWYNGYHKDHGFQRQGEYIDYSQKDPFLKSAFRDFVPEPSPGSVAARYGFSPIFTSLEQRLELISFYNALQVLVKQQNNDIGVELDSRSPYILRSHGLIEKDHLTGELEHGLALKLPTLPSDNHVQNLEKIFGISKKDPSFENNPDARSIDIGMLFVVKSLSKGWEFYHCKNGDDFKTLANKLKSRYNEEKVSVKLITAIGVVKRNSGDNKKAQYDLNLSPRMYYQQYPDPEKSNDLGVDMAEFIKAVEEKPEINTTRIFFNEDASPLDAHGVRFELAAF